jgi:hypothetical protein
MAINPLNVTKVVAPNSLGDMTVEDGLKVRALEKKLQVESVLDDIFEDLGGGVIGSGERKAIPDAIFLKLSSGPTGTREITVPFLMALSGAPTIGPKTPIGAEVQQTLKYAKFKYEEYSFAVSSEEWGTLANDMSAYGVFKEIQPQISKYMRELHGERIREALLLTHCSVLTGATSPIETAHWNKNWFIANTAVGSQPVYDSTTADFTEKIADVMEAAGSGTLGVDANISLNYLRALEYYATNYLRIDPVMVGGKKTYIVLLPSTQVQRLTANSSGQLGDIYTSMVRSNADEMAYTGVLGRVGCLLLVEDQRYPTITKGGADGSWTLTPNFLKPGDVDNRVKSPAATNWDIGFLLGKGAVAEMEVKGLHFETEAQHYGRDLGTGAFGESGISLVEYDVDAASQTDATRENFGSIVLAMTTADITVS